MAVTIKTQEACEAGLKSLFVIVVVGVAASLPSSLFSLLLPSSLPPEAANQNSQNSPRRLLARASRADRWRPCLHGEGRSGELTTWLLLFGSFSFFPFFPPRRVESSRVGSSESVQALDTYSKTKSRARREQRANSTLFPHPFPPRAPLFPAFFSRPFTCSRMRGASLTASTTAPCVRREVKRKRREGKNALSLFGFLELVEDLFRRPSLALELEPLCFRDANSERKSTACSCL